MNDPIHLNGAVLIHDSKLLNIPPTEQLQRPMDHMIRFIRAAAPLLGANSVLTTFLIAMTKYLTRAI